MLNPIWNRFACTNIDVKIDTMAERLARIGAAPCGSVVHRWKTSHGTAPNR
jgi:hypothetical protein